MIGDSFQALVFIRIATFVLRYFAPLLIIALVLTLILDHDAHRLMLILEILAIAEVAFFVLVYIPKRRSVQKPSPHPATLSRAEREKLFLNGHTQIADPEAFFSKWFQYAPTEEIRRENVKEFFCWAFLNKAAWGPDDEEELDGYADKLEELLGRKLEPGRGSAVALRLTVDPVNIQHRPLLWYIVVALTDTVTYLYLTISGYTFFRLPHSKFLTVFPFRIITLLSRHTTPSQTLSYYHIPHTSKTRLPIIFIHGVGVGLFPYARFLRHLHKSNRSAVSGADGTVGIIAIEVLQICSRITSALPPQETLCDDIAAIAARHGWDKFVLVTHSFGSVIAANALRHPELSPKIASMVFCDPVAFLLQLPDVAYNFTRRPPKTPNQYVIHYFSSTDILVAHTLARKFFWAQNILWREDLKGRNVSVLLSGRDCVAPSLAVGRYLAAGDEPAYERFLTEEDDGVAELARDSWQERSWKGEGLDILWFAHCDHAEIFDHKRDFERLIDIVRAYSTQLD